MKRPKLPLPPTSAAFASDVPLAVRRCRALVVVAGASCSPCGSASTRCCSTRSSPPARRRSAPRSRSAELTTSLRRRPDRHRRLRRGQSAEADAESARSRAAAAERRRRRNCCASGSWCTTASSAACSSTRERTTSGALEATPPTKPTPAPRCSTRSSPPPATRPSQWFDDLSGRVEEDLEAKLATPRVLKRARRPLAAAVRGAQGAGRRARAPKPKQIERDFREVEEESAPQPAAARAAAEQLAATQAELKATLAEIKALPAQAKADRRRSTPPASRTSSSSATPQGRQDRRRRAHRVPARRHANGYLAQSVDWVQHVRHVDSQEQDRRARAGPRHERAVRRPPAAEVPDRARVARPARPGSTASRSNSPAS